MIFPFTFCQDDQQIARLLAPGHSCAAFLVPFPLNCPQHVCCGKLLKKQNSALMVAGKLWILFESILAENQSYSWIIIVAWKSYRLLVTRCEILVASAKFLVALVTRKVQFRALMSTEWRISDCFMLTLNKSQKSICVHSLASGLLNMSLWIFWGPLCDKKARRETRIETIHAYMYRCN